MSSYTSNIGLIQPTPFDPAVANIWGSLLNTNFALVDTAIAGVIFIDVSGNSNYTLTIANGAADQARNAMFVFTGVLGGNILVLWPNSSTAVFSAVNTTTGAFTLGLGVTNGASQPAGTTIQLNQNASGSYYSDGTNIGFRAASTGVNGGDLSGSLPNPTVVSTHLTAPLPIVQGGTGANTPAVVRTNIGLGTIATKNLTVSTSAPSGTPADGDIWLQYTP